MVIELTAEQEAWLEEIALHAGRSAQSLVASLASDFLRENQRFHEGVREGLAQANAGQFVEEDEMQALWQRLLRKP